MKKLIRLINTIESGLWGFGIAGLIIQYVGFSTLEAMSPGSMIHVGLCVLAFALIPISYIKVGVTKRKFRRGTGE